MTFEKWWEHTGDRFAGMILQAALRAQGAGSPLLGAPLKIGAVYESIRALCSVAYHQGRIDEDNKTLSDLMEQTKLTNFKQRIPPFDREG